jgi:ring-1,2-phenylacetyl-CoA epoxidase subunit PaaC
MVSPVLSGRAQLLLAIADDELILGWRDSEWTGIAPSLEEAFDRDPSEYRCAPLVQLHELEWAHTIARHWLYECADEIRLAALKDFDDEEVAGLAAKMDREEVYHRLHAQMWADRLRDEPRFQAAVQELWPYAVELLDGSQRPALAQRTGLPVPSDKVSQGERGNVTDGFRALWNEMTIVRRSIPGATW